MNNIQVSINAVEASKCVESRAYTNAQGEEINIQELKFDLIPVREENQKTIYSHDKFTLVKTHAAVIKQSSEQRQAKEQRVFIGDGISQIWKNENIKNPSTTVKASDSPFTFSS